MKSDFLLLLSFVMVLNCISLRPVYGEEDKDCCTHKCMLVYRKCIAGCRNSKSAELHDKCVIGCTLAMVKCVKKCPNGGVPQPKPYPGIPGIPVEDPKIKGNCKEKCFKNFLKRVQFCESLNDDNMFKCMKTVFFLRLQCFKKCDEAKLTASTISYIPVSSTVSPLSSLYQMYSLGLSTTSLPAVATTPYM